MTELVVVGNGFDLHHGLQTSYSSFAKFAESDSPSTYEDLSKLFAVSAEHMAFDKPAPTDESKFVFQRWCKFESCMGLLDEDAFGRHASEDVSEYMHELSMGEYIVGDFIDNISSILETFRKWVVQIELPSTHRGNFHFASDAIFINFNYTETLESFYEVKRERIYYVHGRRSTRDKLIVGHNTAPPRPQSKHDLPDHQNNPFYEYLRRTQKPVETILPNLRKWLGGFPEIKKISLRGHSLGPVDFPYFDALTTLFPEAKWSFSYYSDDDLDNVIAIIKRLGIRAHSASPLATLSDFEAISIGSFADIR